MGEFNVHDDSLGYTIVNNHILRNSNASLKAKGLLAWMLSNRDDWDYTLAGMKKLLKENETAITSTLNELEELGYLKRTKLMPESYIDENGNKVVVRAHIKFQYDIFTQPIENQPLENLVVENQVIENQLQRNTNIKNTNIRKAPAEPALSSATKSRKRNMIYGQRDSLVDDLESGKDIDIQKKTKKKSPKELFRDECLEIIEHEYSDSSAELLTDYFNFISDPKQADSDSKMKVVKTVSAWRKKLDKLEGLIKEGYDCEKIIKQSLENKKYVFYPLESVNKNSQYNNQQNKFELGDVIPTQMTHEEILAEKQRRLDAGAKIY